MIIIIILSIIPIIIWAFMEPLGFRFSDLGTITTSLGQIFGLVGMVMFSINLILAGRFKFLDRYLKGLDKIYNHHHKIGAISFALLLFHPLMLVVRYLTVSLRGAALFFVPFTNTPITWGIISLLLMIILMCLTFYTKIKYHFWKFSHKFMTLAFFFAVIHTFVISSDISRNNFLRYYILFFALLGLFAVVRKAFFEQLSINKYKYKIKNLTKLNQENIEIEMEPLGKKMSFIPGQFAFFSFRNSSIKKEYHPFSISSSNKENRLKIIIKNLGDFTGELRNLKLDHKVFIDGPYGNFSYKSVKNKNQIWIAGGIGVTPFLSMVRTLESDYKVDLYYSVRESKDAVRVGEFENIARNNPNFKYNLWIASLKGYITAEEISNISNGLDNKDIFLCGPLALMESLKNQFISLGVDIKKIHYENFNL